MYFFMMILGLMANLQIGFGNFPYVVINNEVIDQKAMDWDENIKLSGEILEDGRLLTDTGFIQVYKPKSYGEKLLPVLVLLPGWKSKSSDWIYQTDILEYAEQFDILLVGADIFTTVYESKYYPETTHKWSDGDIPGGRWVNEVVLPFIRDTYLVYRNKEKTGIMGLSTGGRGAVLLSQKYDDFSVSVAMSGTFDLFSLEEGTGEYRIHQYVYGERGKYPERWKIDDSVDKELLENLARKKIFLVHGKLDNVVPVEQSRSFYEILQKKNIDCVYFEDEKEGHSWDLWAKYTKSAMQYVNKVFNEKFKEPKYTQQGQ